MAVIAQELAFAPRERSFIVSCMEDADISGYVEVSNTKDFSTLVSGDSSYGFIPDDAGTNKFHYNVYVPVDPDIAGPGDIIYWRIKNYTTGSARQTNKLRLKRPRSHETNWNFVVGGSAADLAGTTGLSDNCKQFCVPTAMALNPDFICIPGDIINASVVASLNSALAEWQVLRSDIHTSGIDIPIYFSPGDVDREGSIFHRTARGRLMPSAGAYLRESQVIRGPQIDPFQENPNDFNSYYAFGHGNALFIFINDWPGGVFLENINDTTHDAQRNFVETVLKEHRHKYKWCFTFTHTSVDETDPTSAGGSVNTIAESEATKTWLMGLHNQYKINAHFSGHYHGWRVHHHQNGTVYVNCVFGSSTAGTVSEDWNNTIAFANVRIGVDEYGNSDPNGCKIDIVNAGVTGVVGEILNTTSSNNGVIRFVDSTVVDHKNNDRSIFNSSRRAEIVKFKSNWLYNAESSIASPVDFVITRRFMDTDFKPAMWDESLSTSEKSIAWKTGTSPFWGGVLSSLLNTASGFISSNLSTGTTSSYIRLPFSWYDGTQIGDDIDDPYVDDPYDADIAMPTPMYFLQYFDIPENITIEELQLIYEIEDAAYIWINGILCWYNDGEGSPASPYPFSWTSRPMLNANKVDPSSSEFAANVIEDLEPIPNSNDNLTFTENAHSRSPEFHYELQGQPIRITDVDVINSLKNTGNVVAVMLLQGRDIGASACVSADLAFDLEITAFGTKKNNLFAPHIKTPERAEQYNRGTVEITWDINDPPYSGATSDDTPDDPYFITSVFDTSLISYEIEYTDNYIGKSTNWHTLKRRIPYEDTAYDWKVGKMIKSNSVRIRMRAKNSETEEVSDWSISDQFAINVFELIPPAIVSPIPNSLYTDFIMIILDESLTKNTYHQKVRYTLEYSSRKQEIEWTTIRQNLPFGQNIIRWNIEDVPQSDDYVLRLTAKNFSTCQEASTTEPDQISRRYIYNIRIQQSGLFLIDTKPPQAIIKIDNSTGVTKQREQIINVFAEDATTQVETIQMRECDASSTLSLGDLEDPYDPNGGCPPVEELLDGEPDFNNLLGKAVPGSSKVQWTFDDRSGLRKLEAMLSDSGGNLSLQESVRVFLTTYGSEVSISDFIIVIEQRDKVVIDDETEPPTISVEPSVFEVVYLGTTNGKMYVLEPFARLLYQIENKPSITKLIEFNDAIYLCTYKSSIDQSRVYRHDVSEPTLLETFPNDLSEVLGVSVYDSNLYFGLKNGEVWKYNGFVFSLLNTFSDTIKTLYADRDYLYIGFQNSQSFALYNGSTFTTLDIE